ncbi:MAG TPA: FAD-dependent oxidoreductase [Rariglobus sp.]|jgi:choline dehydrogenase-like flavoprotein|nr:FAD-dependent oxidoreductase [Rariglobus sp.]
MILTEISALSADLQQNKVIIIGGGTVGLYMANELRKSGRPVVVIESGNRNLGGFSSDTYKSIGLANQGLKIGRSRSLGGTSNLWGGQLVEFQEADFTGRSWMPNSTWPVDYKEISAYYCSTYENLGLPKKICDDREVFRGLKMEYPCLEGGVEVFLTRWLKTPSMAVAFEKEIKTDPCFEVLLNHTVVGFNGADGLITGVKIIDRHGACHLIKGGQFVLAAGTIEIIRLMLHAANDTTWRCPWKNNTNVGAYFQDHTGGRVALLRMRDKKRFYALFSTIVYSGFKFHPKLRLTTKVIESERIHNMQGMFSFESSIGENLIYLKQFVKSAIYSRKISGVMDFGRNLLACGKHLIPLIWTYFLRNRILIPSESKISMMIQTEHTPLAQSCVRIDPSVVDEHGLPKVILDWRIDDAEIKSIRDFTLRCKYALEAAGLADVCVLDDLLELKPSFMAKLRDNYHHAGGVCMGTSQADGVVDSNLRVFGTKNLYVAGAATFRTGGNANTTFLALVFSTRLVHHLSLNCPKSNLSTPIQ